MGTTSRRSTRKNGYKRSTPPNALVRNRSIIGGTKVPGIGAPKIQLAKRSSTAWHTTLAVRAKAIACSIGLQGMRTPTVCLYPWTTAGAHLVNYHQAASFASVCCHSVPVSPIASHVTLRVAPYLPNRLQKKSECGHEIRLLKRREEETLETGEINLLEEVGSEARV